MLVLHVPPPKWLLFVPTEIARLRAFLKASGCSLYYDYHVYFSIESFCGRLFACFSLQMHCKSMKNYIVLG